MVVGSRKSEETGHGRACDCANHIDLLKGTADLAIDGTASTSWGHGRNMSTETPDARDAAFDGCCHYLATPSIQGKIKMEEVSEMPM